MLKDKLFTINEKQETANGCTYRLLLNPSHPIYEAHFPNNPVTPGACIMQIIKELAEELLHLPLQIDIVKSAKFLSTIHPRINNEITVELNLKTIAPNNYLLSAIVFDKETVFAKCCLGLKY
ncbi:MAG: hypothetical protein LBN11_04065 [Tannerella sp.]|jgi:3-hydroxyacyl-[acyl-carrier-protein] dehydratase|nr:hypothetical protein [Tannerella sp.]